MEFIKNYSGNSEDSNLGEDTELTKRQLRSVYLITYSQADMTIFPTRQSFADAVIEGFDSPGLKVLQWVCCKEQHKTKGEHYHMAIKLNKVKRWLYVKESINKKYNVVLHFSAVHANYYSAWSYVTKNDSEYLLSTNHPDLTNTAPRTTVASGKRVAQKKVEKATPKNKGKKKKFSAYDVSNILREKNIKTKLELYALAETQRESGKMDLYTFIINNPKKIAEIIDTTWAMCNANAELTRSKKTRLEILVDCSKLKCTSPQWKNAALEILRNNRIPAEKFCNAVKILLEQGRGKYRNIIIVGPANCGKTFILKPLMEIFRCFANPASSTFAWVGVDNAEVIFLNDFRWSHQVIPWHDFLLLLEGDTVHLPAPKTHFAQDICLTNDVPIFATSSSEIKYITGKVVSQRESNMMDVRWNVVKFHHVISESEQKTIPPCKHCFANFVLQL